MSGTREAKLQKRALISLRSLRVYINIKILKIRRIIMQLNHMKSLDVRERLNSLYF